VSIKVFCSLEFTVLQSPLLSMFLVVPVSCSFICVSTVVYILLCWTSLVQNVNQHCNFPCPGKWSDICHSQEDFFLLSVQRFKLHPLWDQTTPLWYQLCHSDALRVLMFANAIFCFTASYNTFDGQWFWQEWSCDHLLCVYSWHYQNLGQIL
jgi:hypothetical protein